jgi:hypothetical protein
VAGNFRTRSSRSTVELVGATDTQDVVETWVTTAPSGITFPIRIGDSAYNAELLAYYAEQYSTALEALVALPNIAAIYYEQDVNAAGNLEDMLVFVVTSDNGALTREVRESLLILLLGNMEPVFTPIIAELNQVQNL